jgi:hypothetical protein
MTATSGIATKRTWSDVRLETAFRGKGEQAASAICELGPWDVIVGDHFRSFWLRKKSQGSSDNAVCKAPGGGQHEWNAASRQPFPPVRAGAKADHPDRRNRHDARSAERIRPEGQGAVADRRCERSEGNPHRDLKSGNGTFGHEAMSDLSPLCAPKRTPPTTTDLWVHALVLLQKSDGSFQRGSVTISQRALRVLRYHD